MIVVLLLWFSVANRICSKLMLFLQFFLTRSQTETLLSLCKLQAMVKEKKLNLTEKIHMESHVKKLTRGKGMHTLN